MTKFNQNLEREFEIYRQKHLLTGTSNDLIIRLLGILRAQSFVCERTALAANEEFLPALCFPRLLDEMDTEKWLKSLCSDTHETLLMLFEAAAKAEMRSSSRFKAAIHQQLQEVISENSGLGR